MLQIHNLTNMSHINTPCLENISAPYKQRLVD